MNIAVIGAGSDAIIFLDLFSKASGYYIAGIYDEDFNAPAMLKARELGIPVYTDIDGLFTEKDFEIAIDFGSNPDILKEAVSKIREGQELVSGRMSRLMWEFMNQVNSKNQKLTSELIKQFEAIRGEFEEATEINNSSFENIEMIMRETKYLSINASIEAERAGEYGKGFSVVATHIQNLAKQISQALLTFGKAAQTNNSAIQKIHLAEQELSHLFISKEEESEEQPEEQSEEQSEQLNEQQSEQQGQDAVVQ